MKNRTAILGSVQLLAGTVFAAAAFAHHSAAVYDTTRSITLTGTVTEWLWANPHCALTFDVKDEKGNVRSWSGETTPPADILARGWSKKMFKPGDPVTVTLAPGRNGEPIGRIVSVVVNGKTYGGASPGPSAGGANAGAAPAKP